MLLRNLEVVWVIAFPRIKRSHDRRR